MRAHHRPDRQHEGQDGQALPEPLALPPGGLVEPGIQHPAGGVAPVAEVEVHQQEGKVVLDVDVRQPVIELDAVEEDRATVLQQDIPEVQVGVAAAGEAGSAAGLQHPGGVRKASRRGRDHRLHSVPAEAVREARQEVGVGVDGVGQAVRPAAFRTKGRGGVEAGDFPAKGLGQGSIHGPRPGRQDRALVEPPHLDDVVHCRPTPVQLQPVAGPGDGVDPAVDVGRRRRIEGDLPLSRLATSLQGGEVHIAQVHRPLHLPGGVARQVDAVAGGLDPASAQGGEEGVDRRFVAGLRCHG